MPQHLNLENNKGGSIIKVDLNSSVRKNTLSTIAENKGMTLTNFVRSILCDVIEKTPEHLKQRRRFKDDED